MNIYFSDFVFKKKLVINISAGKKVSYNINHKSNFQYWTHKKEKELIWHSRLINKEPSCPYQPKCRATPLNNTVLNYCRFTELQLQEFYYILNLLPVFFPFIKFDLKHISIFYVYGMRAVGHVRSEIFGFSHNAYAHGIMESWTLSLFSSGLCLCITISSSNNE